MSVRIAKSASWFVRGVVVAVASSMAGLAHALPPGDGAFGAAQVVPGDVSMAVRIRSGATLRADATLGALRGALERLVGSRELGAAWERFGTDLGIDGASLAERLIGQDAVYAERMRGDAVEWVAIVRTEQPMQDLMVARLKPAVSVGGRCVYPQQRIATSWRPPYLLVGSADRTGLLDETVARFDASGTAGSLAEVADLRPMLGWEPWPVEVVLRHGLPTGGLTAFAARPDDGVFRIRHRSRFDRPPIHVTPGPAADEALLAAAERLDPSGPSRHDPDGRRRLATLSWNAWRGPLDAAEPLDAVLLEGGFDESMRGNLAARQVAVVGDAPVRGTRVRAPSVAVALEVRDPLLARRQWDAWARRLAESIGRRAGLPAPADVTVGDGPRAVRTVDLGPPLRTLTDDHPFARDVRLCWCHRSGPGGHWLAVGSDASLVADLAEVVAETQRSPNRSGANELAVVSGDALAAHVRSWLLEPSILVRGPSEDFVQAASVVAEIAAAAPRVTWQARSEPGGVVAGEFTVELRTEPAAGAR